MIDLHCHVLPGIDDGPETIEGSIALARGAVAAGTRTLVATPHVSKRYPNDDAAVIARLVEELNARLAAERIPLDVLPGAEIALTRAADLHPAQLSRLRLGGGPWLLIEPASTQTAADLDTVVSELQRGGHQILLAHPERCTLFHRDPLILESLVHAGVLTSITAGSLVGRFGEHVRRFALRLAQDGLIHNIASDAHDHLRRPPSMAQELERAGLGPLTEWLTQTVPAAILNGGGIPSRPAVAAVAHPDIGGPRRRWWRRHPARLE